MKRRPRRLNWVRDTRDPGVAAAYERSAHASADWTEALRAALRSPHASSIPVSFPAATSHAYQYALPLDGPPPRDPVPPAPDTPRRSVPH